MSRILVCGGRSYADFTSVSRALVKVHISVGILLLIHGGVSGADAMTNTWALKYGVPLQVYPPDHERHGEKAIDFRNRLMISEGRPHLVIAFPGGPGTADLLEKAAEAGLPVWHPSEEPLENVLGNGTTRLPSNLTAFSGTPAPVAQTENQPEPLSDAAVPLVDRRRIVKVASAPSHDQPFHGGVTGLRSVK